MKNNSRWYQKKWVHISIFILTNIIVAFSHWFMPGWEHYITWAVLMMLPGALLLSLSGAPAPWILLLPVPNIIMYLVLVAISHDFTQMLPYGLLGLAGGSFLMCICLLLSQNKWYKIASTAVLAGLLWFFVPPWTINMHQTIQDNADNAQIAHGAIDEDSVFSMNYFRVDGRQPVRLQKGKRNILINYWTLSCGYCIWELPDMYELMTHNPYPDDFEVYSVLLPSGSNDGLADSSIRKVLTFNHPNFLFSPDKQAFGKVGFQKVPTFIILDTSGQCIATGIGSFDKRWDRNLPALMKKIHENN